VTQVLLDLLRVLAPGNQQRDTGVAEVVDPKALGKTGRAKSGHPHSTTEARQAKRTAAGCSEDQGVGVRGYIFQMPAEHGAEEPGQGHGATLMGLRRAEVEGRANLRQGFRNVDPPPKQVAPPPPDGRRLAPPKPP
jgi:hypothetical protein